MLWAPTAPLLVGVHSLTFAGFLGFSGTALTSCERWEVLRPPTVNQGNHQYLNLLLELVLQVAGAHLLVLVILLHNETTE